MKIQRYPGYVQVSYPEMFGRNHRLDNLTRMFTAIQPGSRNLLIDISGHSGQAEKRDRDEVRHFARTMADAFKAMSDQMELVGIICRTDQQRLVQAYIDELERLGYGVRLFTEHNAAVDWVRIN